MNKWKHFTLPKMSAFKSTDKNVSPYEKFFVWIVSQYKVAPPSPKHRINVSAASLTTKDIKKLDKVVETWLKKIHKLSGRRFELTYGMHRLDISPTEGGPQTTNGAVCVNINEFYTKVE